MAISKKKAPMVEDANLNRILRKIYDDINEIVSAVNQSDTSVKKATSIGKPGDMRIVKRDMNEYAFEARTTEGWIESTNTTASGFQLKERD